MRTTDLVAPAIRSGELQVSEVHGFDAVAALRDQWRVLADLDPSATVFQTPEWVLSWWEHLAIGEQPAVTTARDADGHLVALAPHTRRRMTPGIRRMDILGRGGSLTEYVDILVHPEAVSTAIPAVVRSWMRDRSWDLLTAPNVPADHPFGATLLRLAERAGHRAVLERHERVWRPLSASWETFTASLGRNQRKHLKKFANRLSREDHGVRFVVQDDPAQLDGALDRFFALHRLRARADLGVQHKDRFDTPSRRAFLRAAARRLSERGQLYPCFLEVDGAVVAAQLCFVHQQTLYPYHSGYDPAWAWHGVMLTLFARCIAFGIETGCTAIDLGLGLNQEKARWGGEARPVFSLVLGGAHPRGHAAMTLYRAARAWRNARTRPQGPGQPDAAGTDDDP